MLQTKSPFRKCRKCLKRKHLDEFYDSQPHKCKECVKAYTNNRRLDLYEREKVLESDLRRSRTPERKAYAIEAQRKRRTRERQKYKARNAVNNAIRDGRIQRLPCEICSEKAQAHHEDYSKPFEIRWLCFKHHRELGHHQKVG